MRNRGGKLIANFVGFLRRDLSGLEGLAHLVGDHVALLLPPGDALILAPGKSKLRRCRVRITGVGGDKFAIICLVRVFTVAGPVGKTLSGGPPLAYVHGDNARGRRSHHLLCNRRGVLCRRGIYAPLFERREAGQQVIRRRPQPLLRLEQFFHIRIVGAARGVDTLGYLIEIAAGPAQERHKLLKLRQLHFQRVSVQGHLAEIGRRTPCPGKLHLPGDDLPLPLSASTSSVFLSLGAGGSSPSLAVACFCRS